MIENSPDAPPSNPGPGRPRALDDVKRAQFFALVSYGCTLSQAARQVGCSLNTIRREAKASPSFDERLRFAKTRANLDPLRVIQQAARDDWRAAGWWLERTQPERFARRAPTSVDPKLARRLLEDILEVLGQEVAEPVLHDHLVQRVGAIFEYRVHVAADRRRTRRGLRRAMKLLDQTQAALPSSTVPTKPVAIDSRPQQPATENDAPTAVPGPDSATASTAKNVAGASSPAPKIICVADLPSAIKPEFSSPVGHADSP